MEDWSLARRRESARLSFTAILFFRAFREPKVTGVSVRDYRVAALGALSLLLTVLFSLGGAGDSSSELVVVPAVAKLMGGLCAHPIMLFLALFVGLGAIALYHTHPPEPEIDDDDHQPALYPLRELAQFAIAGLALLFLVYTILGVIHHWNARTIGLFFAATLLELVLAVGLGISVAFKERKALILYASGMVLTVGTLAVSIAVFVFFQ